jgi:uncharacterized protein (TIGR01244 family)
MYRQAAITILSLLAGVFAFAGEVTLVSMDAVAKDSSALPQTGVISAGQPDAKVLSYAAEAGYEAIIDLRTEKEDRGLDEEAVVLGLGMDYVSLPIDGKDAISFENAAELDRILSGYDGPVMVHCGSGNRVGALFALLEKSEGASDEEAMAAGKTAGMTRLEPVVKEKLAAH